MSIQKTLLFIALLGLAIALILVFGNAPQSVPVLRSVRAQPPVDALGADGKRQEMAASLALLNNASRLGLHRKNDNAEPTDDQDEPLSEEASQLLYKAKKKARLELYESTLHNEGINTARTREHERSIEQLLKNGPELAGTTLQGLTCSESLCKAELLHDNEQTRDHFMNQVLFLPPWNTNQFGTTTQEGEKVRARIYYAKAGTKLPKVGELPVPSR